MQRSTGWGEENAYPRMAANKEKNLSANGREENAETPRKIPNKQKPGQFN
jgi:hypothetical protein